MDAAPLHQFVKGIWGGVRYVIGVVITVVPGSIVRFAALCLVAGLLVACGDGGGDTAPTGTGTRSPTPVVTTAVPSDVAVDFERAEQLYYEGEYEQALTIYAAAAQKGTGEEKQHGLIEMARIQAERGENSAAEASLEAYRKTDVKPAEDRVALFMLGRARLGSGDLAGADEAFEEYIALGGPAAPYAWIYRSQVARGEGNLNAAAGQLNEALRTEFPGRGPHTPLPAQVRTDTLMQMAEIVGELGYHDQAADAYLRAAGEAIGSFDASEALWSSVLEAEQAGDVAAATDALYELIVDYPAGARALEALSYPLVAQIPAITTRERALVHFRNFYNDDAFAEFSAIVAAGSAGVAEAEYYLGIISERRELWNDAIAHYDLAIGLAQPPLQAQAMWDRATVLERIGLVDEAIAGYVSVADTAPGHEQADEALFRAGMLSYQLGRAFEAENFFTSLFTTSTNAEERARGRYWAWKAHGSLSAPPGFAEALLQDAMEADPIGYHGLQAAAALGQSPELGELPEEEPPADWATADAWMTEIYGPEDAVAKDAVLRGAAWLRANELIAAGLGDRADDEFGALLETHAAEPWIVYRLVRAIDELGRPWVSSPAAFSLMAADAPREIFRLVYPLEFWDIAKREAEANDISPFLLLGLVRQESLYQPDAVSIADALGLTQVIPTTGEGIAEQLGVEFRESDLLRPRTSLRFGAYYLGQQIEGFGGEVAVALSGYNGGPGNAARWWEAAGGDRDLFVETIDYPETRAYVELVLENYARYLYAYGVTEDLGLPE